MLVQPTKAVPPTDLTCDFEAENGKCGWVQALDDDFNWRRDIGGTPSYNTGPAVDHTTGTSEYFEF